MDSDDDELFLDVNSQGQNNDDNLRESSDDNVIDKEDKEHSEYVKTDNIRRFQFDYDEHVALADETPAAQLDGNALTKSRTIGTDNFANVAPGEGSADGEHVDGLGGGGSGGLDPQTPRSDASPGGSSS